jgi:protease I
MNALVVSADGFEDSELSYPYYRLQEAGWDVTLATPDGEDVSGKHGVEFEADAAIDDHDADDWVDATDLLVVPGGQAPESMRTSAPETVEIIREFDDADKPVASICHGAQLLISADVLAGREATAYWPLEVDVENAGATFVDEEVVVDDNLVTSRYPADLPAFMAKTLELAERTPAEA